MRLKNCVILLIIILLISPSLWSLETVNGRVKLILHEGIGRFSLYYQTKLSGSKYLPLFVDQDPRTSTIKLVINNKIIKLGESSEFKESAELTASGARFIWESSRIKIIMDFAFIASKTAALSDGVQITISLENISDQSLEAGVSFLLDTYLGEEKSPHFTTDSERQINREATISLKESVDYWLSPWAQDPANIGLQCPINQEGITRPDKIVFANWKRLNDVSWSYETSDSRNFNLLPYSINDSAVCHYYEPARLKPGTIREIVIVLGNYSASGYSIFSDRDKKLDNLLKEAVAPTSGDTVDPLIAIKEDLSTVNNLISEINRMLADVSEVTAEEIRVLEEILKSLRSKADKYSGGR
jgi:hypothetical protein